MRKSSNRRWFSSQMQTHHTQHEAMRSFYQSQARINTRRALMTPAIRTRSADIVYGGLALSVEIEFDEEGAYLTTIQATSDGTQIDWFPQHIASLIKTQALAEMEVSL